MNWINRKMGRKSAPRAEVFEIPRRQKWGTSATGMATMHRCDTSSLSMPSTLKVRGTREQHLDLLIKRLDALAWLRRNV